MNLVIVESPTKAKTISQFLGKDFEILSSYGHIRDLPRHRMGVDIEKDFNPHYVIPRKNQKIVKRLKNEAKKAKEVILATDEDREGESIAWHLTQALKIDEKKTKRIVFHEITKEAIEEALKNPRLIDLNLVNSQQARRILDRLVGYELSPFLWKKIASRLSAGRVQSVALRLIVEKEKEIEKFKPRIYFLLSALFKKGEKKFKAPLYKIEKRVIKRFDFQEERDIKRIKEEAEKKDYFIEKIEKKEIRKNPPLPFTTSTLQQEANQRFNFSAKKTMFLAQQLYEGIKIAKDQVGLITYMRTDSLNLSDKFLKETKKFLEKNFTSLYSQSCPRKFKTKSKLAQEAHEAIRPTSIFWKPEEIKPYLSSDQYKIYNLIWQRTLASQMPEAKIQQIIIFITSSDHKFTFRAVGSSIKFDGYLKVYKNFTKEEILPLMEEGELLEVLEINYQKKETEPPKRYSDAGLVKVLEEYGIGRPSTYAPTIATLLERGYARRVEKRRLKPTELGILVSNLLVEHFPQIVDYRFTAEMEKNLDLVAQGEKQWILVLKEFYFPFKKHLREKEKEISKEELAQKKTSLECPRCGNLLIEKISRFGRFLACSNFPDCRYTQRLEEETEETQEVCERCGKKMVVKRGKYGKFLACSGFPECRNVKPYILSLGIKCPKCRKGEILQRKKKKIFYTCSRYPKCDFISFQKPG